MARPTGVWRCVPFRLQWDGYTVEEIERRSRMRRLDLCVGSLFALWYLLQGLFVTDPLALASPPVEEPSSFRAAVLLSLAAMATYLLLVIHIFAFPAPTADLDTFKAQRVFGRFIFLTRHCVTLQMWHQVLSALGMLSPWLAALTAGMSPWVDTVGWFVTIQYFVLVAPSAPFKEDCSKWAARGVQFKEVGTFLHAPPVVFAVLDILLAKQPAMLAQAVSLTRTVLMICFYIVFYLGLIVVNFNLTGFWPYGFMKEFGTNIRKWISFVGVQIIVLMIFFLCNVLLMLLKTSLSM